MPTRDFTTPVELRCILGSSDRVRRALPLIVITFVAVFIGSAVVTTVLLDSLPLGCAIGVVLGLVLCWMFFSGLKDSSGRENQRLTLSPVGMRATDGVLTTLMRWSDVRVITTPKGASRVGIVGDATLSLTTGGDTKLANRYAALTDNPDAFLRGEKVHDSNGALFPGDFERSWRQGVIGDWLHHYRPDLRP